VLSKGLASADGKGSSRILMETRATLTTLGEAAMYSRRGNEGSGLVRVAISDKYCFSDSKAATCLGPQAKSLAPLSIFG
jgi:hypothetical protein